MRNTEITISPTYLCKNTVNVEPHWMSAMSSSTKSFFRPFSSGGALECRDTGCCRKKIKLANLKSLLEIIKFS